MEVDSTECKTVENSEEIKEPKSVENTEEIEDAKSVENTEEIREPEAGEKIEEAEREENPGEIKKVQKPLRRSIRERKPVYVKTFGCLEKARTKSVWTKTEKEQLLNALRKLGEGNLKLLAQHVPTKSINQISYFINLMKNRAVRREGKSGKSFSMWLSTIKKLTRQRPRSDFDPLIIAPLLISMYENFPAARTPGCIDFKKLYEFLFCRMAELSPPQLNDRTKLFLQNSLKEVQKMVKGIKPDYIKKIVKNPKLDDWPSTSMSMNPLKFPVVSVDLSKGI